MANLRAGYAAEFRAVLENDVGPVSPYGCVDLRAKSRGSRQAPFPATRPAAIIS